MIMLFYPFFCEKKKTDCLRSGTKQEGSNVKFEKTCLLKQIRRQRERKGTIKSRSQKVRLYSFGSREKAAFEVPPCWTEFPQLEERNEDSRNVQRGTLQAQQKQTCSRKDRAMYRETTKANMFWREQAPDSHIDEQKTFWGRIMKQKKKKERMKPEPNRSESISSDEKF